MSIRKILIKENTRSYRIKLLLPVMSLLLAVAHIAFAQEAEPPVVEPIAINSTQSTPVKADNRFHQFRVDLTNPNYSEATPDKKPKSKTVKVKVGGGVQMITVYLASDGRWYVGNGNGPQANWTFIKGNAGHPNWGDSSEKQINAGDFFSGYEFYAKTPSTALTTLGYQLSVEGQRLKNHGPGDGGGDGIEELEDWSSSRTSVSIDDFDPKIEETDDQDEKKIYLTSGVVTIKGSATAGRGLNDEGAIVDYPYTYKVTVQGPEMQQPEVLIEQDHTGLLQNANLATWDIDTLLQDGTRKYPPGEYSVTLTVTPKDKGANGTDTVNVTIPKMDLGIINSDSAELTEDEEDSTGGYVVVNNDNDDYTFSSPQSINAIPDIDKNGLATGIVGENDLVSIKLHKIEPAVLGGKYKLVFSSSKIKIWRNATKSTPDPATGLSAEVMSDQTEFDATVDTTLFVEGLSVSDGLAQEEIALKWVKGEQSADDVDKVNFTVYLVGGAANVPGFSTHYYTADVPTGQEGQWSVVNGQKLGDVQLPNANTCAILWSSGPIVGKAIFQPVPGFKCEREVNVVLVQFDLSKSGMAYTSEPQQLNQSPPARAVGSMIASASTSPAMRTKVAVSKVEGPKNNRGVRFLEMGFIQTGQVSHRYAYFDRHNIEWWNSMESINASIDMITSQSRSTFPWYDTAGVTAFDGNQDGDEDLGFSRFGDYSPPDEPVVETDPLYFTCADTPRIDVTDRLNLFGGNPISFYDDADEFSLLVNFKVFFVVRTRDTSNESDTWYTIRLKAGLAVASQFSWKFDGSGTVANNQWFPTTAVVEGAQAFTEITQGFVIDTSNDFVLNDQDVQSYWQGRLR